MGTQRALAVGVSVNFLNGFGVVYFYWVVKLATNFKRIITGFGVV